MLSPALAERIDGFLGDRSPGLEVLKRARIDWTNKHGYDVGNQSAPMRDRRYPAVVWGIGGGKERRAYLGVRFERLLNLGEADLLDRWAQSGAWLFEQAVMNEPE